MKLKTYTIRTPLLEVSNRSRADSSPPGTAFCYLNCKASLFLHALSCVIHFQKQWEQGSGRQQMLSVQKLIHTHSRTEKQIRNVVRKNYAKS